MRTKMMLLNYVAVLLIIVTFCDSVPQSFLNRRFKRLPIQQAYKLKMRLREKISQYRQRNTQTVCYDLVGCFDLPHSRSPLQKIPEDPATLDTKFYLFRRNINFSNPQLIRYEDDGISLEASKLNFSQPLKLVVHGYLSKWNEKGALVIADSYIKLKNQNVILMDWQKGARGPHYANAAANTELVGRQLGILLLMMLERGLNPKLIHLIGFSLGSHVAGSASEYLKSNGFLIGRITGLDPAGPLFRNNYLREKHKKLDREDADFVDIMHTDSSPFATDGFGLWEPIGHVDFYPNGGQDQPGCTDTKSLVASRFEPVSERMFCSHIRAWKIFQESLVSMAKNKANRCEFIAFSCPGGLPAYEKGLCFPRLEKPGNNLALDFSYRSDLGKIGEDARGEGVMYLSTTASKPYCGTQLQASVQVSQKTQPTTGILQLLVEYDNNTVDFHIKCEILDIIMTGTIMNGLGVAPYNTLSPQTESMHARVTYYDTEYEEESNKNDKANSTTLASGPPPVLLIDRIIIRDMYGVSWHFCSKDTTLRNKSRESDVISIKLTRKFC